MFAVLVHEAAPAAKAAHHHTTHWLLACLHAPECNLSTNTKQGKPASPPCNKQGKPASQPARPPVRMAPKQPRECASCTARRVQAATVFLVMHRSRHASTTGCITLASQHRRARSLPASACPPSPKLKAPFVPMERKVPNAPQDHEPARPRAARQHLPQQQRWCGNLGACQHG